MIVFDRGTIGVTDVGEYNIIFSRGVIDLTEYQDEQSRDEVEINVIFSQGTILLRSDQAVRIKTDSAFAQVNYPDGQHAAFGSSSYINKGAPEESVLEVDASVVFGQLDVIVK